MSGKPLVMPANLSVDQLVLTTFPSEAQESIRALLLENNDLREQLEAAQTRALQLENEAREDPLTGLLNRRGIDEELKRAIDLVRRYDAAISLLFIDLDDFKNINDEYGHAVGDNALVHISELFRSNIRRSDIIARIGGDEFAILLWQTNEKAARTKAEMLSDLIAREPLRVKDHAVRLGASIGSALITAEDEFPGPILARADQAMYQVKDSRQGA